MMKLSIIIPVYNVEQYVERCLLSVTGQGISSDEYEIIVVNDGSTDGSLAAVEKITENFDNVRVVSQENQGLSAARNKGLSIAKGEYVWFVDSDDWIAENCLSEIIPLLNQDIDCVSFSYCYYIDFSNKQIVSKSFSGIKSGMKLMKIGKVSIEAPYSIFKLTLFSDNNVSFLNNIYHEDSELIPKIFFYAKKCIFLDAVCYYYFQREGSIMSSFSLKKATDILLVNENLLHFAEDTIKSKSERLIFYYWIGLNINTLLSRLNKLHKNDLEQISSVFIHKKDMFSAMMHSKKIKYKLEGLLFFLAPKFTLSLYNKYFNK